MGGGCANRSGRQHTGPRSLVESPQVTVSDAAPRPRIGRMDLRPVTDPVRSLLYVTGGWACLGLALLGVLLPVLPATPFVLLASWCFYRGSPRIHAWLHRSRTFGPMLDDWHRYRGIRRTVKHRAVVMVAATVAVSLFYASLPGWMRYVVIALVATGLYVIWTVPTLPDDTPRAPRTIIE